MRNACLWSVRVGVWGCGGYAFLIFCYRIAVCGGASRLLQQNAMMAKENQDGNDSIALPQPLPTASLPRYDRLLAKASNQQLAAAVSQRTKDWITVTTPVEFMRDTLQHSVQVSPSLLRGIRVVKITSQGKRKGRVLTISKDRLALFCTHARMSSGKDHNGVEFTKARTLHAPRFSTDRLCGWLGIAKKDKEIQLRDRYVRYIDVADLDFVQTGLVGTVSLEKSRTEKRLRGLDSPIDRERHQIVTIGHHGTDTLSLLISDDQQRRELVVSLCQMREAYQRVKCQVGNEALLLRYIWYDVDVNRDGRIEMNEFMKILSRLNLYAVNATQRYHEYAAARQPRLSRKDMGLSFYECIQLLDKLCKPTNSESTMVNDIWKDCFGSSADTVSAEDFWEKFLIGRQRETDVTLDDAKVLFNIMGSMELYQDEAEDHDGTNLRMNRKQFEAYLMHSELNDAYDPETRELQGPLVKPIAQYWINSSHNTYITGNQLESISSVEMYMRALRRSCKCVELDCWDGEKTTKPGESPIPIVYHGNTLTSKLIFSDIIQGIKAYLDTDPTTYPIILSIESHCSPKFEDVIAATLKSILGKSLYSPSQEECESGDLPSPESLRGMVIIKGKRPPEPDDDDNDAVDIKEVSFESRIQHKKVMDPSNPLASLTRFHGTKFRSFDQSLQQPTFHMHSIGETKITKILNKAPENASRWREYNRHHLTRTYPAGARVDSSNYNPTLAWAMGCQMVALNFQTSDPPLILNDGLFRQNGGCGYVAKPDSVLGLSQSSSPIQITIRVLSGSCLPKPKGAKYGEIIDPFVKVTVHDVKEGSKKKEHFVSESQHTSSVSNNGFRPVWKSSPMNFTIESPDVAMIQFTVWERDVVTLNEPLADSAIPFSCLRRGYRSVALYDPASNARSGAFGFASLLVEIGWVEVTSE